MAVTIVEEARPVTGGAGYHAGTRVAAALDSVGGLRGVREFPATAADYSRLLGWLGGSGTVCLAGIEGAGGYGAGLARHMAGAGVRVGRGGPPGPPGPPPAGQAPARWTRSAPRGPRSPAGPAARPRAGTARWRRSAR